MNAKDAYVPRLKTNVNTMQMKMIIGVNAAVS